MKATATRARCRNALVIGLTVALGMGVLAAVTAVIAAPLMDDSFGRLSVGDMCILLSWAAVMLMCELVAWALMAIPVGFRRILSASVAHLIGTVLNFCFTLAVLLLDRTSVAGRVGGRLVALWAWGQRHRVASRPPSNRAMRFSLTQLTDIVHRRA
jgi:hypothetical protein